MGSPKSSKLSALQNDQDFDDINSNVQDGRKTELSVAGRSAAVSDSSSYFVSLDVCAVLNNVSVA